MRIHSWSRTIAGFPRAAARSLMRGSTAVKGKASRLAGRHWPLVLLYISFVALGASYSLVNPAFESPDEPWHYQFVKFVADEHELPVMEGPGAEDKHLAEAEGVQPPLYYLLGAAATFWVDTGRAQDVITWNPHFDTTAWGNNNRMLHTHEEAFPYHGWPLAVHIVRLMSVLIGSIVVVATYLLGLELFRRRAPAAGAAALVAFNPQFLFISSSVNNDTLAAASSSLVLLLAVRLLLRGLSTRGFIALGAVCGVAALSKVNTLAIVPVVGICLLGQAWKRRDWRYALRWAAALGLLFIVVAGWWFARNLVLYDNLTTADAMFGSAGRDKTAWYVFTHELRGMWMSSWMVFGWHKVVGGSLIYSVFDAVAWIALAGLGVWLLRGLLGRRPTNVSGLAVLVLFMGILFITVLIWSSKAVASTGRLLFPSLSAGAIVLFLGVSSLFPRRTEWASALVLGTGLLVIASLAPPRYLAPAFARSTYTDELEPAAIPSNGDTFRFGEYAQLLGYEVVSPQPEGDRLPAVPPGGRLELMLYWRCLAPTPEPYSLFLHLQDTHDCPLGQTDTYPGLGTYPTTEWRPGDVFGERVPLPSSQSAAAPSLAHVELGLYRRDDWERLQVYDGNGTPTGTSVGLARLRVVSHESDTIPGDPLARFGEQFAVLRADLRRVQAGGQSAACPPDGVAPGHPALTVALTWRCEWETEQDYTVFVHCVDEAGEIRAQHDGQPRNGNFPTSAWSAGEVISDEHMLDLQGVPPGRYYLWAGMYDSGLTRLDAQGAPSRDNAVLVGTVDLR